MCFVLEKCSSVLREYRDVVEIIIDKFFEKGEIKVEEIWEIYKTFFRLF